MASISSRLSNLITGVHGIHVQKCVWFEVELQRAQVNHEAEVIQYSNNNVALIKMTEAKVKQIEENTNTRCLVNEHICLVKEQESFLENTNTRCL